MNRLILASVFVAIFCAAGVRAQSPTVSIANEPHHKRLLYTNDMRVWDVTVAPGDATAPFVHDYDVATVVIGDGTLAIQRNGEPLTPPAPSARGSVIVAEHTGAQATYRIENTGTTPYRAIEIEAMREDGKWLAVTPIAAAGSSVMKESRAFEIYELALKPGDGEVPHQHSGAIFVVLLSGTLEQGGIGGEAPVQISEPGQWLTLPRFASHTVKAAGGGDARAIEIEVR